MQTLSVSNLLNLFHRHSEEICRALRDKDLVTWESLYPNDRRRINYSANTATGTLRGHIAKWHLVEYLEIASNPKRQWRIQLSSVEDALHLGYTFDELKEIAKKDGKLNNLPPRSTNCTIPDDTAPKNRADIPSFSLPQLHTHLVNFIVVDDQSLNVVECKEFQHLLLFLREDLKDADVPHHTKIKKDIIKAWKEYFVILKQDLAVRILSFIRLISLIISQLCSECSWGCFFHSRYMVQRYSTTLPCSDCPLDHRRLQDCISINAFCTYCFSSSPWEPYRRIPRTYNPLPPGSRWHHDQNWLLHSR